MEEKTMSANKEYQPKTKKELKRAIQEYQQGKHQERGEPNDWDVSLITDMSQLLGDQTGYKHVPNVLWCIQIQSAS
jgi:hypothetical protein